MNNSRDVMIGTSGFSYRHWRGGVFYPKGLSQKEELKYFAGQFSTVELNNPFYRLPSRETFATWRKTVPADFVFAVKVSRYITHIKRLKDCAAPVKLFMRNARGLGAKLGPLLCQLPANAKPNLPRLEEFLRLLPRRHEWVFEFRNPEWFTDETYQMLAKYRVALCAAVSPTVPATPVSVVTADFAYIRMHSGASDGGRFNREELRECAARIDSYRRAGLKVYVYFNNDWHGYAIENARELAAMLTDSQASDHQQHAGAIA
jgi:uncharacterized protein YecE (DUF72 family)